MLYKGARSGFTLHNLQHAMRAPFAATPAPRAAALNDEDNLVFPRFFEV
jgi:hypothetical protein